MNLLIVESPFQLLGAYEAISYYKLQDYRLYIRYSSLQSNTDQIKWLISVLFEDRGGIREFTIASKAHSIRDYIKIACYSLYFRVLRHRAQRLFVGNLESRFLASVYRWFPKYKIIALDDGAKSIALQKNFDTAHFYNLFTIYSLLPVGEQKIEKHIFASLHQKLDQLMIDDTRVLFLGVPIVSKDIMTRDKYLEALGSIQAYFKGKELVYITHRAEDSKTINAVKTIDGIEVVTLAYPVEFYGMYEGTIPSIVASFYSTALYTMNKIYALDAVAFEFDYSQSEYRNAIEEVYAYYAEFMQIERV